HPHHDERERHPRWQVRVRQGAGAVTTTAACGFARSRKRLVRNPTMTDDFFQHCLIGLTNGSLIALIALGYTMVYGIIELVNFAHGDLVMLGSFLALTLLGALGLSDASPAMIGLGVAIILVFAAVFCATLN